MLNRRRIVLYALAAFSILLLVAIISGNEEETPAVSQEPTKKPTATSTMPPPEDTATPSPTATRVVPVDFVLCERLRVNYSMDWGQAPLTIFSDNPDISGELQPGDHIRLISSDVDERGHIWVQVYPQDGRAVGRTDDRVWIAWYSFWVDRDIHETFTCED